MARRLEDFPEYISGRITESGANTFTQQEIALPTQLTVIGKGGTVIGIELVSFEYASKAEEQLLLSADTWSISLTTTSRTALGTFNQAGTMYNEVYHIHDIGTVASFAFFQTLKVYRFGGDGGLGRLVVSPSMFIQVQGSSVAAATTTDWKIGYRLIKIDTLRFARLLAAQTSGAN